MSRVRTTKPKLRDACQFLAWLASDNPDTESHFYDYCNGVWDAARSHARMLWESGRIAGCYEVMTEDWKGVQKVCVVNVCMEPRFDVRAKQDP